MILPDLEQHLAEFSEPGRRALVFIGPKGGRLRRGNFRRSVWRPAVLAVGVPDLHFHDLRHTGNTLAAATGELMARMGHAAAEPP